MKIILAGGGTAGPIMPMLAVMKNIKKISPSSEFIFFGTGSKFEQDIVTREAISYQKIYAGKLRRYFSLKNFLDPFLVIAGYIQSLFKLKKIAPDGVFTAGGFVGVPVVWAAWCLGVPVFILQQDLRTGLANKLEAPFASKIFVAFQESLSYFSSQKTVWTGNPAREDLLITLDNNPARENFFPPAATKTLLVLGGGTGSKKINEVAKQSLPILLPRYRLIHLTGRGKAGKSVVTQALGENYKSFEFIHDMGAAYQMADLVVCRAGLSTITELSLLAKPAIVVPLAGTHQEDNAEYLKKNNAAIIISENEFSPERLVTAIDKVFSDVHQLTELQKNISKINKPGAGKFIAQEIIANIK